MWVYGAKNPAPILEEDIRHRYTGLYLRTASNMVGPPNTIIFCSLSRHQHFDIVGVRIGHPSFYLYFDPEPPADFYYPFSTAVPTQTSI
jgi:hypothetical protein